MCKNLLDVAGALSTHMPARLTLDPHSKPTGSLMGIVQGGLDSSNPVCSPISALHHHHALGQRQENMQSSHTSIYNVDSLSSNHCMLFLQSQNAHFDKGTSSSGPMVQVP